MKKKLLINLICITLALSLYAIQKNQDNRKNQNITITGYVISKGNLPFVFPVIRTEDGTEYLIICKEKTKNKLLKAQGYKIKFTGTINEEGFFVLKKWKKV